MTTKPAEFRDTLQKLVASGPLDAPYIEKLLGLMGDLDLDFFAAYLRKRAAKGPIGSGLLPALIAEAKTHAPKIQPMTEPIRGNVEVISVEQWARLHPQTAKSIQRWIESRGKMIALADWDILHQLLTGSGQ